MTEGICPECKIHCCGQALKFRRNQLCVKCGSPLSMESGGLMGKALPPKVLEYQVTFEPENLDKEREKTALSFVWN